MKIYMIRHGETDFNRTGIVQGSGVNSDLNQLGREQAQAFYEKYKDVRFDALYVSDLKRTHQTLQPWVGNLGHRLNIEPGLTELSWGVLEGKTPTPDEMQQFRKLKQDWQNGLLDRKIEGGESPRECHQRIEGVLKKLKSLHMGQTILVCTHGRTSRVLLSAIASNGLHDMERFNHSNTGLNILNCDEEGRYTIETINDTTHLMHLEGCL